MDLDGIILPVVVVVLAVMVAVVIAPADDGIFGSSPNDVLDTDRVTRVMIVAVAAFVVVVAVVGTIAEQVPVETEGVEFIVTVVVVVVVVVDWRVAKREKERRIDNNLTPAVDGQSKDFVMR